MKPYILLVDDEAPFIETLQKRLTKLGLTVAAALSGSEALEVLGKHRNMEVVVLDVNMPGMDGITTLQEIKKMLPLVEVILLTGHATVESAVEGMRLGAYDYLIKPCDQDELLNKVHAAVGIKRNRDEKIKAYISDFSIS